MAKKTSHKKTSSKVSAKTHTKTRNNLINNIRSVISVYGLVSDLKVEPFDVIGPRDFIPRLDFIPDYGHISMPSIGKDTAFLDKQTP